MANSIPEQNKALVLQAFDTLFNKRDYEAAARFWSDTYIQHSAHIEPGREGLFDLIRSAPDTLRYESGIVLAEGDYVILHGRFTGEGRPVARIAADVVRIEDGRLAEHWDVLQDEGDRSRIEKRAADVRRPVPWLNFERTSRWSRWSPAGANLYAPPGGIYLGLS